MEKYTKLRKLGRGSFSDVWLAQTQDSALVALKEIQLSQNSPSSTEVEVLKHLEHPNIVQYLDSFVEGESLFIVMEFVEGGDLAQRIAKVKDAGKVFTEQQVIKWAQGIAEALNCIHSQKIIHRDLKTHNVFLNKMGVAQIGDFGFSKMLNYSEEMALSGVGTAFYLSPEICNGMPYDTKADIWSFGVILYELCALRRPFEGGNIVAIINKILSSEPEELHVRYSIQLRELIFSTLNKVGSERPDIQTILSRLENLRQETKQPLQLDSKSIRKSYQKQMSINIPTPTYNPPANKQPSSAPESYKISRTPSDSASQRTRPNAYLTPNSAENKKECNTTRTRGHFTFNESLLKDCPKSPIRPILMRDFLKKKLGLEVFERVERIFANTKDPAKLLREEPWMISDICGEEQLGVVDVGIAFDVFNQKKVPYPPTSTHRSRATRVFPILKK